MGDQPFKTGTVPSSRMPAKSARKQPSAPQPDDDQVEGLDVEHGDGEAPATVEDLVDDDQADDIPPPPRDAETTPAAQRLRHAARDAGRHQLARTFKAVDRDKAAAKPASDEPPAPKKKPAAKKKGGGK